MNNAFLVLQKTLGANELAPCHNRAVSLIYIWRNNYICNACLIFHGEKDETHCSSWPLPRNYTAGGSHEHPILDIPQLLCRQNTTPAQFLSAICHRVFPDRQSCFGIICNHTFGSCHLF